MDFDECPPRARTHFAAYTASMGSLRAGRAALPLGSTVRNGGDPGIALGTRGRRLAVASVMMTVPTIPTFWRRIRLYCIFNLFVSLRSTHTRKHRAERREQNAIPSTRKMLIGKNKKKYTSGSIWAHNYHNMRKKKKMIISLNSPRVNLKLYSLASNVGRPQI